jgi:hypothetical protein
MIDCRSSPAFAGLAPLIGAMPHPAGAAKDVAGASADSSMSIVTGRVFHCPQQLPMDFRFMALLKNG